jgi:hypothetical protein
MLLAGSNLASQSIRDDYEQGGAMSKELEAQFNVLVKYEEGHYLVEIVDPKDVYMGYAWAMPLAEARDVSFHKAIEEAFSTLALNDQDYIEASLI